MAAYQLRRVSHVRGVDTKGPRLAVIIKLSNPSTYIPFVTLLSKLGLNASPLNSVSSSDWPSNFRSLA